VYTGSTGRAAAAIRKQLADTAIRKQLPADEKVKTALGSPGRAGDESLSEGAGREVGRGDKGRCTSPVATSVRQDSEL